MIPRKNLLTLVGSGVEFVSKLRDPANCEPILSSKNIFCQNSYKSVIFNSGPQLALFPEPPPVFWSILKSEKYPNRETATCRLSPIPEKKVVSTFFATQ